MEEKIKTIIAGFIKTPIEEINQSTLIDRSAVNSSIMIHRMYANLAKQGIQVENYTEIKTFGDLTRRLNAQHGEGLEMLELVNTNTQVNLANHALESVSIGIDMEEISSLPVCKDFREDPFYMANFNASEIAYCILQSDPYASFAGLFAAKEAIVKADNNYRGRGLNTIVIDHTIDGKPLFSGFQISISHSNNFAIAVAFQALFPEWKNNNLDENRAVKQPGMNPTTLFWIGVLSLVISIVALVLVLHQ